MNEAHPTVKCSIWCQRPQVCGKGAKHAVGSSAYFTVSRCGRCLSKVFYNMSILMNFRQPRQDVCSQVLTDLCQSRNVGGESSVLVFCSVHCRQMRGHSRGKSGSKQESIRCFVLEQFRTGSYE